MHAFALQAPGHSSILSVLTGQFNAKNPSDDSEKEPGSSCLSCAAPTAEQVADWGGGARGQQRGPGESEAGEE